MVVCEGLRSIVFDKKADVWLFARFSRSYPRVIKDNSMLPASNVVDGLGCGGRVRLAIIAMQPKK